MADLSSQLKPFTRRVRWVRAWRGLAIGATLGGLAAAGWAGLDWANVAYATWAGLGTLVGAGAVLGAIVGAALPIRERALALSIDRRAELDDRLATAEERSGEGAFDAAIRQDADAHLRGLKPKRLYPLRVTRWHGGALALPALAAALFLLGNTPLLLSDEQKRARDELHKQGQKIDRIAKENFENPVAQKGLTDEEKRLADELRRYQQELEKARMTKEESLQKANELAKKADELMQKRAEQTDRALQSAGQALEKMQKDALAKQGMPDADPKMAKMSEAERKEAERQAQEQAKSAQKQMAELKRKQDEIAKKLQDPKLSSSERKALEAQQKALQQQAQQAQKQAQDAQKQLEQLKLSEEAQKALEKMMKDPAFKKLQEMAQKLQKEAEKAKQKDKGASGEPQMSKQEREQMKKELEQLLKQLKDDKAMQQYLQKMMEAMQQGDKMGNMGELSMSLGMNLHLNMPGGGPDDSSNIMQDDTGKVNHTDKPVEGTGKTKTTSVKGQQRDVPGETPYIEIKAPTTVGNRSSVPYTKVLPSYRKKAESALNRQEIPKQHERRVKAYFESLGH